MDKLDQRYPCGVRVRGETETVLSSLRSGGYLFDSIRPLPSDEATARVTREDDGDWTVVGQTLSQVHSVLQWADGLA